MFSTLSYYAALGFEALFGVFGLRLYEEPSYNVVGQIDDRIEIRSYGPRLAAEVVLPEAGEDARNAAFQLLFAYIAGANQAMDSDKSRIEMTMPVKVHDKERLAMTVPVQASKTKEGVRMQFFLPNGYTLATAPKPKDKRVRLVIYPAETIATLRFSGTSDDFQERQSELLALLKGSAWRARGEPYALNYDAPFTIPFLRRNEAAVAVKEAK